MSFLMVATLSLSPAEDPVETYQVPVLLMSCKTFNVCHTHIMTERPYRLLLLSQVISHDAVFGHSGMRAMLSWIKSKKLLQAVP